MSNLEWYGSSRASDPTVDAYDLSTRARVATSMHPYLARSPETLRAMVESDMTVDELIDQSGQMYGMQSADSLQRQLSSMSGPTQRAIWGQLTVGQQMALSQIGYQPEQSDDESTINSIMGGIAGAAGAALGGISNVVMPIAKPALETLSWAGNWPGHLYRTIRLQDGFSQAVGGAFGILGAIGALALAPATFGASLGTFMTLGVAGLGALGAASAASFVSSSITNPGDWWRAFQSSWNGERTFKPGALREAETILGDPRLVGLAQDLALVEGFSMLDFAQELASTRDISQNRQLATIEQIASRIAGQGTAEFQAAANAMVNVMANPDFQRAVVALQHGKISPGRDLANLARLDPESGLYRVVSGLADATFTIAVDPTLMLGAASKYARAQRYGLRVLDGAPSAERFLEVAMKPGVQRYHSVVARAVEEENTAMIRSFAPEFQREFGRLIEFKQMLRDTGELADNQKFSAKELREYFIGATNYAPLLRGVGTVRGSNELIMKSWGPLTAAYRRTAAAARAFTFGLQDPRLEKEILDQLRRERGEELAEALPPHIGGTITEAGVLRTGAETVFPEIYQRVRSVADSAKPWRYNQVSLDAYEWGRALGDLPVVGRAVARIGEVITSMTTMAPAGKSVALTGDDAFRDVQALAELGRYMGMPSWARRMWADTILAADSPAARVQAIHGWLDNALTITGARWSEEGSRLVDQFLTRSRHMYGVNDEVMVNGKPMHAGIFLNQQANEVVMPGLKALFDATAKGHLAKFLGIADLPVIEPLMTKVWKPFVLLRIGFIPRAAGEEMLNFMLRGGIGALGQEFGARSLGQANVYDKAIAKRTANKLAELTADEAAALLRGPLAKIPTHMRPLVRMMARVGWGDPALHYAERYGNWLRGMLDEGITSGGVTRRLRSWEETAATRSEREFNLASNLNSILLGSKFSWRRMIAGGVHDDLVEAAEQYYRVHATTMLREVSATNAGPLDPGYDRANTVKVMMPTGIDGALTPVEMMQVRGSRAMVAAGDPFFNKALHDNVAANAEDPVVRVMDAVYRRVKPASVSHETVYQAQLAMEDMGDVASNILLDFVDVPREDVWRATLVQLAPQDPQLAQLLELITPDSGMPTYDEIVETVTGWVQRHGALIDGTFVPLQSWHRAIADDLRTGQKVLQQLDTLDEGGRAWLATHLHANGWKGVGMDVEDIGRIARDPMIANPGPQRRYYRGVSTPSQIEFLPDGGIRLYGQRQDHWSLREPGERGPLSRLDSDQYGMALSFTTNIEQARHYAELEPDSIVGMIVEVDADVVIRAAGGTPQDLPSGREYPDDVERGDLDFGLYSMGTNGEVNFNLNGAADFTESQLADLEIWQRALDEAVEMGDQAGVLVAERMIDDIRQSRGRVVKQEYLDFPPGSWRINDLSRARYDERMARLDRQIELKAFYVADDRARLDKLQQKAVAAGIDVARLEAGDLSQLTELDHRLDDARAELSEFLSHDMYDELEMDRPYPVIPADLLGRDSDVVITDVGDAHTFDALLLRRSGEVKEMMEYEGVKKTIAEYEHQLARSIELRDEALPFDDALARAMESTRQMLVALDERIASLTLDELVEMIEHAVFPRDGSADRLLEILGPDVNADVATRYFTGSVPYSSLDDIIDPDGMALATAMRVSNPSRQIGGERMIVKMWKARTGAGDDELAEAMSEWIVFRRLAELGNNMDIDTVDGIARAMDDLEQVIASYANNWPAQQAASSSVMTAMRSAKFDLQVLAQRRVELEPGWDPGSLLKDLAVEQKIMEQRLKFLSSGSMLGGFHSGDDIASSPLDWFDRMTGFDRPYDWGMLPAPDPFYGSVAAAEDDLIEAARTALMNPHLNDDVARSVRTRSYMDVEQPSIARGGTVPLYLIPATASTSIGDAFNTFDQLLPYADRPVVLVRNRKTVEALLGRRRWMGDTGDFFVDDVELAKELAVVLRNRTGVALDMPVRFRRVDRRWLDGRPRGSFRSEVKDGDTTRLWSDDSGNGYLGSELETLEEETVDRFTDWAKDIVARTNQLRLRGTKQFLRPRMKPGDRLPDGSLADPSPLVYRMDRVNGRYEPVGSDYRITRKERFFDAKGQEIPFGHGDWFEQGESTMDEAQSVMWELVGPAMRDGLDDMWGTAKFLPQEAVTVEAGQVMPTGDVGRVFRSKEIDVQRVGADVPNFAIGETLAAVKTGTWEKFVNFGFDRVIGPSIDAIARNPMSFHFFAQRYMQNKKLQSWLFDPSLVAKISDVQRQVWDRAHEADAVISAQHVAEASRSLAAFTDGEQFAKQWTDGQALAWMRGHNSDQLERKLKQTMHKAAKERGGLANEARNWARKLQGLDATAVLSVAPRQMEYEEFLDFVAASIPQGALRDAERMADAIARLSDSHPLTNLAYDEIESIAAAMDNIRHVREAAGEFAAQAAIADMVPFLDSHEFKTQFAEYGKGFLPFWYAEENFMKRWVRTLIDQGPAAIRKAQLGYMGLKQAGVVRTDQNGKDWFVYPGSGLLIDTVSRLVPSLGTYAEAAGMMFQTPTDSMLPGINNRFGTPAFNPLVTIPLDLVTAKFPELQPLERSLVGDYGATRESLKQLVPAYLVNIFEAITGDVESNQRYASAQMAALAQLDATGQIPETLDAGQVDEILRKVANHARIIVVAQSLAGFFVPGPPSQIQTGDASLTGIGVDDPASMLSSSYISLVRMLGIEQGTMRYLELYPNADLEDIVNPLAYTQGKTQSASGAPLPATERAMGFYDTNRQWMESMPNAGPWLLPQDTGAARSQYAYDQQTINGLRKRMTPEQFLLSMKFKEGAREYFDMKQSFQDAIAEAGQRGDSERVAELKGEMDYQLTVYKAAHPLFAQELESGDGRTRRQAVIEEMRVAVLDPNAPDGGHLEPMRQLMGSYNTYVTVLSELSQDRTALGRAEVENLKLQWEQYGEQMAMQHPEVAAFWRSVLRPESSLS